MKIVECRSCHASVVWTETERKKRMLVDASPSADGSFVLVAGDPPKAVYKPSAQEPLYSSHFRSCPDRDKWRKS